MAFWKRELETTVDLALKKPGCTLDDVLGEGQAFVSACRSKSAGLLDFLSSTEIVDELISRMWQPLPEGDPEALNRAVRLPVIFEAIHALVEARTTALVLALNRLDGTFIDWCVDQVCGPDQNGDLLRLLEEIIGRCSGRGDDYDDSAVAKGSRRLLLRNWRESGLISKIIAHLRAATALNSLLRITAASSPPKPQATQRLRDEEFHFDCLSPPRKRKQRQVAPDMPPLPEWSPIYEDLMSPATVQSLVALVNSESMVDMKAGLAVLTEMLIPGDVCLIETGPNRCPAHELPPIVQTAMELCGVLKKLLETPEKAHLVNTAGELRPPLGDLRLQTTAFISTLMRTNFHAVNMKLVAEGVLASVFDLFFQYPWAQAFHHVVLDIVVTVFIDGRDIETQSTLFRPPVLLHEKIMKACEDNKAQMEVNNRLGHMGHVLGMSDIIQRMRREFAELREATPFLDAGSPFHEHLQNELFVIRAIESSAWPDEKRDPTPDPSSEDLSPYNRGMSAGDFPVIPAPPPPMSNITAATLPRALRGLALWELEKLEQAKKLKRMRSR